MGLQNSKNRIYIQGVWFKQNTECVEVCIYGWRNDVDGVCNSWDEVFTILSEGEEYENDEEWNTNYRDKRLNPEWLDDENKCFEGLRYIYIDIYSLKLSRAVNRSISASSEQMHLIQHVMWRFLMEVCIHLRSSFSSYISLSSSLSPGYELSAFWYKKDVFDWRISLHFYYIRSLDHPPLLSHQQCPALEKGVILSRTRLTFTRPSATNSAYLCR